MKLPDKMVNFAKIMLIIYNSAKDEKSINISQRLNYKHIVAMKRATIRLLKQIQITDIDTSSLITVETIDQDVIYFQE